MVIQAIIGLILFEYFWAKTKRYREINKKRDEKFPEYRRNDAKYWTRARFYPGALLTMPTRLVIHFGCLICAMISVNVFTLGHDFNKGPFKEGMMKNIVKFCFRFFSGVAIGNTGIKTTVKKVDADYTYYLGEGYKNKEKNIKKTSTIISNHVGFLDGYIHIN